MNSDCSARRSKWTSAFFPLNLSYTIRFSLKHFFIKTGKEKSVDICWLKIISVLREQNKIVPHRVPKVISDNKVANM